MPIYDVRLYAVESDEFPGMPVGHTTVAAPNAEEARFAAKMELWDDCLSITCDARAMVDCHEARELAAKFLDSAPEDTISVREYDWEFRALTRQELEATGLLKDFDQHAQNIGLDPAKSDLSRPVVVSIGDRADKGYEVWDGVHRIMSALARGVASLPAVVGVRKRDN